MTQVCTLPAHRTSPIQGKGATAGHSWREFFAYPHGINCGLHEADRGDLAADVGDEALRHAIADDPTIGGLLIWQGEDTHEGGSMVMLTDQGADEERRVMSNARWLVSCGAVYAPARVGHHTKDRADWSGTVAGQDQYVWFVPNDRDVEGMRRRTS